MGWGRTQRLRGPAVVYFGLKTWARKCFLEQISAIVQGAHKTFSISRVDLEICELRGHRLHKPGKEIENVYKNKLASLQIFDNGKAIAATHPPKLTRP